MTAPETDPQALRDFAAALFAREDDDPAQRHEPPAKPTADNHVGNEGTNPTPADDGTRDVRQFVADVFDRNDRHLI